MWALCDTWGRGIEEGGDSLKTFWVMEKTYLECGREMKKDVLCVILMEDG